MTQRKLFFSYTARLSSNSPRQLRYQWEARKSVCSCMYESGLKTEILLNNSYVNNMDRASFRLLGELGISTPSIVAIQQPSGDQAISLMRSPIQLTGTPPTCGCFTANRLLILYDKRLSSKNELILK